MTGEGVTLVSGEGSNGEGVTLVSGAASPSPHTRPGFPGKGEANHLWKGEEVSYHGALKRLRVARGSASTHACHECGGPALRWVLVGEPTHRSEAHGWVYSLDFDDYVALCARCHRIGRNA